MKKVFLYILTFILAICSIVYELLLAQTLSFFSSNAVVWYSVTIGLYLGAIGIGISLYKKLLANKNALVSLTYVECALSVLGLCAVPLIQGVHSVVAYVWINNDFFNGSFIFYPVFVLLVVVIGVLTGFEISLLFSLEKEDDGGRSKSNYVWLGACLGSLVGAILFSFVLSPYFELLTMGCVLGLINAITMGFILSHVSDSLSQNKIGFAVGCVLLVFVLGISYHKSSQQYSLKKYYYLNEHADAKWTSLFKSMKNYPEVTRLKSSLQKIDIVKYPTNFEDVFDDIFRTYTQRTLENVASIAGHILFVDGHFKSLMGIDEVYHEYFAHAPMMMNGGVPKHVLVLGGGNGVLVKELLKNKAVQSIQVVAVDPAMTQAAKEHPLLKIANNEAFLDPRVRILNSDVYRYVRRERQQFDAIYLDLPYAKDHDSSRLYTREFYDSVRKRLTPNGYAVIDAPEISGTDFQNVSQIKPQELRFWNVYYNTLKAAGFKMIQPYHSVLEDDNKDALQILTDLVQDSKELTIAEEDAFGNSKTVVIKGRKNIRLKLLQDFIGDHRHGFIFVRKRPYAKNWAYSDFGLTFDVLNAKRIELMSKEMVTAGFYENDDFINSIMRPRLPHGSIGSKVRMPL